MNELNFNLQNQAYKQIIGKILRNEYKPGQKISQKNIEEDLQLGRTPVREALLRLRRDGLIYTIPQSGTYVTKIDLDAANNARFIRENLERKIVSEAALLKDSLLLMQARDAIKLQEKYAANAEFANFFNADEEFHKTFYLMTDHAQVWDWLQTINIQFNRFRWLRLSISELPWGTLIEQHKEILDAIEQHDPETAVSAAAKHLHLMFEEEMAVLQTFPEYFDNLPQ
ncbi:GntR family transcriptional regulator [Lactococcus kimchii]|uniref:GntR family transcriptional regulator n=1 Tax=Lactococcus sp. S-13 TaxID=2507158 RepID=UPI00102332AE|nr:GntR family transcriptional regulator [Lactococcus sp. S-13]RZI48869.1 GntR family transcriptional regulator [Lactococcus sp. S-13]